MRRKRTGSYRSLRYPKRKTEYDKAPNPTAKNPTRFSPGVRNHPSRESNCPSAYADPRIAATPRRAIISGDQPPL
jgi:hypothetical protein